ncbi:MAG TPA: flagellar hook-associated protein FlgK, partial [Planctomycetota bacterium]|nr:flagellar hook-associated protein FlgK [Planctomycetota bacterium]
MSLSIGLDLGLRSLLNSQGILQTIGNNLANANTPGYARQDVLLEETRPLMTGAFAFGRGADIAALRRIVDESLEARLRDQGSILSRLSTERVGQTQLESIVAGGGDASLPSLLSKLFDSASGLASHPADDVDRQSLLSAGGDLAGALRELAARLGKVKADAGADLEIRVKEVNELAEQIAGLNQQIAEMKAKGIDANALLDTRTLRLQDLAKVAGVTTVEAKNGTTTVLLDGHTIVSGNHTFALEIKKSSPTATPVLRVKGSVGDVAIGQGAIAGLLKIGESVVPGLRAKADAFAHALALAWNRVHSTGLPKDGGFQLLVADNKVANDTAPLSQAGLPFDVTAGDLYVNVTDTATGAVTKTKLAIDPNGSLADFAAQLNGVAGLTATIDGGVLRISAAA